MAEREAGMEEDAGNLPARDGDDGEDEAFWGGRRLFRVVDRRDEDEQPVDEEDEEAPESFELDSPAERSGHIAVVDRNIMYVWGGYKVGAEPRNHTFSHYFSFLNHILFCFFKQEWPKSWIL